MLTKISGYGPVKSAGGTKRTSASSGVKSFSELLEMSGSDEPLAVAQPGDVAATAAVSNMLLLQEITEEELRRRKLALQGNNMLYSLEKLRQQLLAGVIPGATLVDLRRQLSVQKQSVADPRLTELIEDIELRVAVELAKLEMANAKAAE